jgi:subtilisin family serine protease
LIIIANFGGVFYFLPTVKNTIFPLLCLVFSVSVLSVFPQQPSKPVSTVDSLEKSWLNWYNSDPAKTRVMGTSANRAFAEFLKDKTPLKKVVVAIIDCGVDIGHVDLKGKIWTNKKEIPGNGIDDDNNGYVDDIHGWNFLGNSKGENIAFENFEQVRLVRKFQPVFKDIRSAENVPADQQSDYKTYIRCSNYYEKEQSKYQLLRFNTETFEKKLNEAESVIEVHLDKPSFTERDVYNISSTRPDVIAARDFMIGLYTQGFNNRTLPDMKEKTTLYLQKYLNLEFEPRKILGDNPDDINDKHYGNNDVNGPLPEQGTMVAGIIAACRDNGTGIDGIAENTELMVLRITLKGDERDKDVALAIRYAVENGAAVINLSTGKTFSPQKTWIDDAVKFAATKNVLIIHEAGNDAQNLDESDYFPTDKFPDGTKAENWITVGASSMKADKELCAPFTNYGKQTVDFFAPGLKIISLCPGNKYGTSFGTGMACAVVSGAAALVWEYYPELTAVEMKDILLKSSTNLQETKVVPPNLTTMEKTKVPFASFSKTGGVVNVLAALIMADKISKVKTEK